MAGYRLTPRARIGFRNILEYVEVQFGARVAERVLGELEAAFERLAESPGAGSVREDITSNDEVLFWAVPPSLIAYRNRGDVIEILFVERGERDWENMLEDEF